MPTSANDELTKVKMYAVVDGEYREVMELQGKITLSEADEAMNENISEYIVRETNYPDATKQEVIGELVRCDKCRWHYEQGRDIVCAISKDVVRSDDYCSYGERRSDNA